MLGPTQRVSTVTLTLAYTDMESIFNTAKAVLGSLRRKLKYVLRLLRWNGLPHDLARRNDTMLKRDFGASADLRKLKLNPSTRSDVTHLCTEQVRVGQRAIHESLEIICNSYRGALSSSE